MAAGGLTPVTLFGFNAVREVISSPKVVTVELMITEGAPSGRQREMMALAAEKDIPIKKVSRDTLDRLAGKVLHQGVAINIKEWPYLSENDLAGGIRATSGVPFLLIIDHVQDVGNLGAIIRSAHLCGVTGVVIPKRRTAQLNSAAVRASAGTAVYLDIYQVGNLNMAIRKLKSAGLWIFGLEAEADISILEADLNVPLALVVGSEHQGISRLVKENCDMLLKLPMAQDSGSYNASVASGIALFEVLRQRQGALGQI